MGNILVALFAILLCLVNAVVWTFVSDMPIAGVDGYRFAMIQDPEGNPVGLIEPFDA